jgi:hypothetical protein
LSGLQKLRTWATEPHQRMPVPAHASDTLFATDTDRYGYCKFIFA